MTGQRSNESIWPNLAPPKNEPTFASLQGNLPGLFQKILPDRTAPRTIVVLPSLSVDQDVLSNIEGVHHYEERMLGMLMLLRLPRTRLIYLTSQPISETIIDYYLHLLQGVPAHHARARLILMPCFDGGTRPLTEKDPRPPTADRTPARGHRRSRHRPYRRLLRLTAGTYPGCAPRRPAIRL